MKKIFPTILALLMLASCSRQQDVKPSNVDYYTCTMHPSVRSQDAHGKCPICSMSLVPVYLKTDIHADTGTPGEFFVATNRQQLIGVTYAPVEMRQLQRTIRAVGNVAYDKQRRWDYVSRVEGYVQKLEVASRGEKVRKGQALLTIHSPDLLTAQREYVDLLQSRDSAKAAGATALLESANRNLEAARQRLSFWNIDSQQIDELEKTRQPQAFLTLYSPFDGQVQELTAEQGRRVMPGDSLVSVVDLSAVWVWANFYEDELPYLKSGVPATVTALAYPGVTFQGTLAVLDPFLDDAKRTVRARIDISNADFKLLPDMYVDVMLELDSGKGLAIPVSAVLPTGNHNIAFVDKGDGRLQPRFVELAGKFGDFYAVKSGLVEGERIVTSANFLIDAEAKVQGALKSWETQ